MDTAIIMYASLVQNHALKTDLIGGRARGIRKSRYKDMVPRRLDSGVIEWNDTVIAPLLSHDLSGSPGRRPACFSSISHAGSAVRPTSALDEITSFIAISGLDCIFCHMQNASVFDYTVNEGSGWRTQWWETGFCVQYSWFVYLHGKQPIYSRARNYSSGLNPLRRTWQLTTILCGAVSAKKSSLSTLEWFYHVVVSSQCSLHQVCEIYFRPCTRHAAGAL